MKIPQKFTEDKIEKFKLLYINNSKEEVIKEFPEYKWESLQNIAMKLKIKRKFSEKRNGDISILFSKKSISFYWIGLILADGYIAEDGTLKIDLAIKDKDYLFKLSKFLNTKLYFYPKYNSGKEGATGIYRVKIKDYIKGAELRKYLGITGQKTYNPFSIDFITNKYQLIAFVCGFIDGDGTIDKKGSIHIDCHKNYYNLFNKIGRLLKNFNIIKTYTVSYYKSMSRLSISNCGDSQKIKEIGNLLSLPLLERKWDRIFNWERSKNTSILLENKSTIKSLRKRGFILKEICKVISYKSPGTLANFCKKNKI